MTVKNNGVVEIAAKKENGMNNYELHMKVHTCNDGCQNPICIAVRKAVEAEREACIEWCAAYASDDGTAQKIIAAIRARGQV